MCAKDKNRYCKMHGKDIFPEYRYSIYCDGNIKVRHSLAHYVRFLGTTGLAIHKSRSCDCVYEEGMILTWNGRVKKKNIIKMMEKYYKEGMPRRFGSYECGLIVRDHYNYFGNELMENWYNYYMQSECKRDQLVLPYLIWKYGMKIGDIGYIYDGISIAENGDLKVSIGVHDKK